MRGPKEGLYPLIARYRFAWSDPATRLALPTSIESAFA